jgi:hypothetical protein
MAHVQGGTSMSLMIFLSWSPSGRISISHRLVFCVGVWSWDSLTSSMNFQCCLLTFYCRVSTTWCLIPRLVDLVLSLATSGLRVFIGITNKLLFNLNFIKIFGATHLFSLSLFSSFPGYLGPAHCWCSLSCMFSIPFRRRNVRPIHPRGAPMCVSVYVARCGFAPRWVAYRQYIYGRGRWFNRSFLSQHPEAVFHAIPQCESYV